MWKRWRVPVRQSYLGIDIADHLLGLFWQQLLVLTLLEILCSVSNELLEEKGAVDEEAIYYFFVCEGNLCDTSGEQRNQKDPEIWNNIAVPRNLAHYCVTFSIWGYKISTVHFFNDSVTPRPFHETHGYGPPCRGELYRCSCEKKVDNCCRFFWWGR